MLHFLVSPNHQTEQQTNLILVFNKHLLPRLRIKRELQRREKIRILKRKPQLPLIITRALLESLEDIIRDTFQFLFRKPDPAILLIKVLLELDLDLPHHELLPPKPQRKENKPSSTSS